MDELIKNVTLSLARWIEAGAAIVIALASLRALWNFTAALLAIRQDLRIAEGGRGLMVPKEEIRLTLGRSLALALELELGADILKTAVAPNWNDVGLLAAIAVLRTALNYFLERELRNAEQRDSSRTTAGKQEVNRTTPATEQ
ncbi:DUF1622 domain-containing protein [Spirosoma luteum]|uniref:DUF1622 domain-containing protein n=1 Tax=Spirosoma luteum TaxID=431553 RepID=UPI00035E75DF|nr:DUF1622 domain-containing protein [Spirosoma luteum]